MQMFIIKSQIYSFSFNYSQIVIYSLNFSYKIYVPIWISNSMLHLFQNYFYLLIKICFFQIKVSGFWILKK
jgi:hypothetical protein